MITKESPLDLTHKIKPMPPNSQHLQRSPSSGDLVPSPQTMNTDNSLNASNRAAGTSVKDFIFSNMDLHTKKEDAKSDRTINFAEKMHYVLSCKECKGK